MNLKCFVKLDLDLFSSSQVLSDVRFVDLFLWSEQLSERKQKIDKIRRTNHIKNISSMLTLALISVSCICVYAIHLTRAILLNIIPKFNTN